MSELLWALTQLRMRGGSTRLCFYYFLGRFVRSLRKCVCLIDCFSCGYVHTFADRLAQCVYNFICRFELAIELSSCYHICFGGKSPKFRRVHHILWYKSLNIS